MNALLLLLKLIKLTEYDYESDTGTVDLVVLKVFKPRDQAVKQMCL